MDRMNRKMAMIVAGMLIAGSVVAGAPAASAAAPRCTGQGHRTYVDPDTGGRDTEAWIYFPAHSPTAWHWGGEGYWSCSLVQGSTATGAIQDLQATMNTCYLATIGTRLNVDGQFGPKTKAALIQVQRSHGIVDNGQYGPETARTMKHYWVHHTDGVSWGCSTLAMFGWPGDSG
jgi:hypothetical protein